jgi:integrase
MSLRKRGKTWWIDITTPSGQRIRESACTCDRKAAQEYHDRIKAEAWRRHKLGEKPQRTWDEAALRFLQEAEGKASLKEYERQVAFWTKHFKERELETIARHDVADIIEKHAKTPATRKDEAAKLLAALPEWLEAMARFALATGLRQSNVLKLEWTQVDLERRVAWVHPDQAKARRAIGVPLNEDAVVVIRKQLGKHLRRVFVGLKGEPINQWKTYAQKAWKSACTEVDIEDFRWHDLRHIWASWHVQLGTPLFVLKEPGGWETLEMVRRYAHLAPEQLSVHAERISLGSATAQIRHKPEGGATSGQAVSV